MPMADTKQLRKNIFLAAYAGGIGHIASSFSCVEILCALYLEGVMRHNPQNPGWDGRDRFIMSKGHGALALYSVLSAAGYFPEEELWSFCRPGSILGGEPNTLEAPGVEASTGSLGHGLSIALGIALALKTDGKPNKVYALLGDGECQEGSIWEAVIAAPMFGLGNLIAIIDSNQIQKMDFVKNIVGPGSLERQFAEFGWKTLRADGHNIHNLVEKLSEVSDKPCCIIADTIKGKGVSLIENAPTWHWRMPNKKELKIFMQELDIDAEELVRVKGVRNHAACLH